jgi:outer membrane receptor protein involved in Fe transport
MAVEAGARRRPAQADGRSAHAIRQGQYALRHSAHDLWRIRPYIVNPRHTLRMGFAVSAEQTNLTNIYTVLPGSPGAVTGPQFNVIDDNSKLGWNIGFYVQDEWKLTRDLTLNAGLRFDQLYQYVDANQLSPRLALVYKPLDGTSIHAGYARYFTPPYQAQAYSANIALFNGTTNQPDVPLNSPVLPERSNYFDVGLDQTVLPGLTTILKKEPDGSAAH